MKKQDIIRIINEEIEFALEEQEKQLYKVVDKKNRNAFMAGWNQSKANLGKGKIKGDVRDIDAWNEYSQGEGSKEEKDAFLDGWFYGRTTTKLSDVEKILNDKDKIIAPDEKSNIKGLTKRIATKLAAKNPNWSVEKIDDTIELNEMDDPNLQIYHSMIPEILGMIALGSAGVIKAVKYLKSKGLNKQAIVDVIKKAKSQMKDNVNEPTKPLIVVYDGKRLAIEPEDFERLKSGKDIVGKRLAIGPEDRERIKSGNDIVDKNREYAGQEEWIYAKGDWKIEEPINENEGKEKEYTVVYDKLNRSDEEYEKYEKTVEASSKEEAIEKVKGMDPRGKRHKIK